MSQINESAIATPGVYTTEIPAFPPSVAQVATAIPVFVGYAPKAVQNGKPVFNTAVRISSLVEFTTYFGTGFDDLKANIVLNTDGDGVASVYFRNQALIDNATIPKGDIGYQLFNAIQLFFNNGGSNCYILALQVASGSPQLNDFNPLTPPGAKTVFDIIQKEDEPTLIVIPDAVLLDANSFNTLMNDSLQLCGQMQDRFTIMDVLNGEQEHDGSSTDPITVFRNGVSDPALNYGAAYYPWLRTSLPYTPASATTFAYADINIYAAGATTPTSGSALLNSAYALQLENADADMTSVIDNFIGKNLNASYAAPISLTAAITANANLNTAITTGSISSGFGLIPQADPLVEFQNKLIYIANLLGSFVSMPAFKDNPPTSNSAQGLYNAATKAGTGGVFTQIELYLRELATLNEAAPADLGGPEGSISTLLTSLAAAPHSYQLTITPAPVTTVIYGTPGAALSAADKEKIEMAFVRSRIQKLYNNALNIILNFQSNVAARLVSLEQSLQTDSALYGLIKSAISNEGLLTPACGAIAGIYAAVDGSRGVWKAPANVAINSVIGPAVDIDDNMQADLNIDPQTGKSINAIRAFTGKGTLVWGARTLTGNDNDFRYISVRRFFIMVEESVKLAAYQFVFEPNDAKTWTRIRAMIENYLTNLWRLGALAGPKPEAAFWVKVGLGQTMIFQDVLEGRMIVEIGMAPVRPAEFIILRFTQIQQTA